MTGSCNVSAAKRKRRRMLKGLRTRIDSTQCANHSNNNPKPDSAIPATEVMTSVSSWKGFGLSECLFHNNWPVVKKQPSQVSHCQTQKITPQNRHVDPGSWRLSQGKLEYKHRQVSRRRVFWHNDKLQTLAAVCRDSSYPNLRLSPEA